MCGRFAQASGTAAYAKALGLSAEHQYGDLIARYNLAPTELVLVARRADYGQAEAPVSGISFVTMRWGLVPHWSKGPDHRFSMINARAETIAERAAFREPFRCRRCVVPADGFYEWRQECNGKQPYYFHRADGQPLLFAGLWDRWSPPEGEPLVSCTIVVTHANAQVRPIHDRMPVVLSGEEARAWMDLETPPDELQGLLKALPDGVVDIYPVSRRVNRAGVEGAELIERVDGP